MCRFAAVVGTRRVPFRRGLRRSSPDKRRHTACACYIAAFTSMRKAVVRYLLPLLLALVAAGCGHAPSSAGRLAGVWGRKGISDGRLNKPRAMAIDRDDHLYIVDMTARIQVFTTAGEFLRGWHTPDHQFGKPTGLSIAADGTVWVADTHYYRVLVYTPDGKLLRTFGGAVKGGKSPAAKKGDSPPAPSGSPGEFGLVTSVAHDSAGNFYVSEYGEFDRIQKFTPEGKFLLQWGGHGSKPGQFIRPQKMTFDEQDHLWVTDACNHRIQVFDTAGNLLQALGERRERAGRVILSLRLGPGPGRYALRMRVRQPSRAEVHPRRPLAGLLRRPGPRRRGVLQPLGAGPRQQGNGLRAGYQ